MTDALKQCLPREAEVLGPVRAPVFRARDRYRMQTMIKYKGGKDLSTAINRARKTAEAKFPAGGL